jgi:EF hand
MTVPIMSQAVFDEMDKNKDGFVSKGELRLAQRGIRDHLHNTSFSHVYIGDVVRDVACDNANDGDK